MAYKFPNSMNPSQEVKDTFFIPWWQHLAICTEWPIYKWAWLSRDKIGVVMWEEYLGFRNPFRPDYLTCQRNPRGLSAYLSTLEAPVLK